MAVRGGGVLVVRERNGYGRLMVYHRGQRFGPFAQRGNQLDYCGHHDWGLSWAK